MLKRIAAFSICLLMIAMMLPLSILTVNAEMVSGNTYDWKMGSNGILVPTKDHKYFVLISNGSAASGAGIYALCWSTEPWYRLSHAYPNGNSGDLWDTSGNIVAFTYKGKLTGIEDYIFTGKIPEGASFNEFKYWSDCFVGNISSNSSEWVSFLKKYYSVFPSSSTTTCCNYPVYKDAALTTIRYDVKGPSGWEPDISHDFDGTYDLSYWFAIDSVDSDGNPLKIQIPVGPLVLNENFNKFLVVERYAAEYGGSLVYSILYSDCEMYLDSQNYICTEILQETNLIKHSWYSFLTEWIENFEFLWSQRKDNMHGLIVAADFASLDDALYVLQHISESDASYIEDVNLYGHYEPLLGLTLVEGYGMMAERVFVVSGNNSSSDGLKQQVDKFHPSDVSYTGDWITKKPSSDFFQRDENGNVVVDSDGNPIQNILTAEDVEDDAIYIHNASLSTDLSDVWQQMSSVFSFLDFLPPSHKGQIMAFFGVILSIALSFLTIKLVGTFT